MTQVAMVVKVQAAFPSVTAVQIHLHWLKLSKPHWRCDNHQLPMAATLLAEYGDIVNVFEPIGVSDDVEVLCWGMKKIVKHLRGKIIEVGLDVTCKHEKANVDDI